MSVCALQQCLVLAEGSVRSLGTGASREPVLGLLQNTEVLLNTEHIACSPAPRIPFIGLEIEPQFFVFIRRVFLQVEPSPGSVSSVFARFSDAPTASRGLHSFILCHLGGTIPLGFILPGLQCWRRIQGFEHVSTHVL